MAALFENIGPFEETEQWSSYTERFEYFALANKIEVDVIMPTFLSVMGAKTYNLLCSLVQPEKPADKSYNEIVTILKNHYSPKPLIIAERFIFHKRNQEEGESVSQFVAVLTRLSQYCEFGVSLNDTIRDRLVCGLRSEAIQKRLLTEANLGMEKAMEISTSMEMSAREAQQLSLSTQVQKLSFERARGNINTQTYKRHTETNTSGFYRKKKKPVNKMEHEQDEQSDCGFSDSSIVASPSLSQGGEKKGRNQIVPCTVSQLMSASQADESFRVGEVEVAQITIIGLIRSTDKSMTNIQYKVDDMTAAPMDVKQWVDTEDPSVDSAVLPLGTYVKVSGNLHSFQNHRSVVAFSIRQVEDLNEITSHMLEVVQAHMALSKAPSGTMGGGPVGVDMNSNSMTGSWPEAMEGMGGGGYSGGKDIIANGLSPNQNQVLRLIRSSQDFQGISLQELKQRLSGMSLVVIKQAVEFLSNKGHVFLTIDEDHFKSTDGDE